jgi:hypothetical protein
MFLDHFNTLISKIIYKKHYFDTFPSEKHFEKQPQPHFQTSYKWANLSLFFNLFIF